MSTGQAADILGVSEEATAEEITDAHRRLIQRLHTDRGGTDYLAALINQARDTLTSRG
jgi:curved DNA-binding protein CbpA